MLDKDTLIKARELYASSPSHAPSWILPAKGSYCFITACTTAGVSSVIDIRDTFDGIDCLVNFNADHTTEEVLAKFDEAIARA